MPADPPPPTGAPSPSVEIWRDDEGVLVSGSPENVKTLVAQLTEIGGAQLATSPVAPTEALAVFATGFADGATSSQYVRFTDESKRLLEQFGAVPNGKGGFHTMVMGDQGIAGNLEWVASSAGPERALAFQSAAIGLALRTAVKNVEAAVARVEDKVDQVVALLRAERLGNVLGDRRTLDGLVGHLDAGDPLSAADWSSIAALGPAITRDLEKLRAHLRTQVEEVDGSWRPRERASQANELLTEGMLTETLGLVLLAEHNYSQWQHLRIQRIADSEPEKLEAAVRQAKEAMQGHLNADQEFLAQFEAVQDTILQPRDLDGFAFIQNGKLGRAENELAELTKWFADQRLLEFEAVDQRDRPGLKDSAVGVIGAGVSRLPSIDRPKLERPDWSRRSNSAADEPADEPSAQTSGVDDPHPYRWAVDGPPLGTWRTFEGTFSNVMSTQISFLADGTGTVEYRSGFSNEDVPIRWRHLGPGELWIANVDDEGEALDPAEHGDVFRYAVGHQQSDAGSSPVLMNEADGAGWIPAGGFWTFAGPVALVSIS